MTGWRTNEATYAHTGVCVCVLKRFKKKIPKKITEIVCWKKIYK